MNNKQDMANLIATYEMNLHSQQGNVPTKAEVPVELKNKINQIIKSIDGMYQFSGFNDQGKVSQYKAELTKGLYKIRDQIDESNLKDALDLFRVKGGKFPPSVPEFIQAVLGQHEEQRKPPEHVWFDRKALPKYSSAQISEFGKRGIESVRAILNSSKSDNTKV